ERDVYFESVHVMTYQLLHSPSARRSSSSSSSMSSSSSSMSSSKKIDFVVLVTNEVTAPKKARLEKDGATVVVVDRLISEWMTPKTGRWQDCLTKLRLLKMTQYGKITFIDVDHLITQSLDGVFDDPAAAVQHTVVNASVVAEAPLPDTYVFAARPEAAGGYGHVNPPPEGNYFNAGFFVLKPDERMLEYYEELM
ncbi:nucleotide-diphospho-sugar transferase, partial [Mytilinidion resinicola]